MVKERMIDKNDKEYDLRIRHKFEYDEGVVEVRILLPHEGVCAR